MQQSHRCLILFVTAALCASTAHADRGSALIRAGADIASTSAVRTTARVAESARPQQILSGSSHSFGSATEAAAKHSGGYVDVTRMNDVAGLGASVPARPMERAAVNTITTPPVQRSSKPTGAINHDLISTARPPQSQLPRTPLENKLMEKASLNPKSGTHVPIKGNDGRFHEADGWRKMQQHERVSKNNRATVHYQYNQMLDKVADIKATNAVTDTLPTTQTKLQPMVGVNKRWK